jgi:hypothetical protein
VIRATILSGNPSFEASVSGIAVYLDNWAIKALAKGDARLKQRFIRAVRNGGDLLFSASHAIEATGPQGKSSRAFKSFLNQLGAHCYANAKQKVNANCATLAVARKLVAYLMASIASSETLNRCEGSPALRHKNRNERKISRS